MSPLNAAQRLKRAVNRILDEQRSGRNKKTIRGLAKALDQQPNGVGMILKAKDVPHFKLRDLDAIAEYLDVPPSALIRDDGDELWELRPSEMALMRHWRAFPREIQDGLLLLLNFFAGVAPAEKSLRWFLSKYRRLSHADQEYVVRTMDSLLRHTAPPGTGAPPAQPQEGPPL